MATVEERMARIEERVDSIHDLLVGIRDSLPQYVTQAEFAPVRRGFWGTVSLVCLGAAAYIGRHIFG